MATAKSQKTSGDTSGYNMVKVKLPRLSGEDDFVYVCVNDVGYSIKRGEAIEVPDFIAAELDRSEAARDKLYETMEAKAAKE